VHVPQVRFPRPGRMNQVALAPTNWRKIRLLLFVLRFSDTIKYGVVNVFDLKMNTFSHYQKTNDPLVLSKLLFFTRLAPLGPFSPRTWGRRWSLPIDWVAHFPDQKNNASWPFAAHSATPNFLSAGKFQETLPIRYLAGAKCKILYGPHTPVFYFRNQRNLLTSW
jgi:hypothetical protein